MVDACGAGTVVEVEGDGTEKHTCTETSGKNVMLSASVTAGASPAEWAWGLTGSVGIADIVADAETDIVIKAVITSVDASNIVTVRVSVLPPVPLIERLLRRAGQRAARKDKYQSGGYPGDCR